jgi:hypothetical protein
VRGAQPDAECPRCHHRQPPAEGALATCLRCGLTYPPKELQQRAKKPTVQPRAESNALAVTQPTSLTIDEAGDETTYRWTDHPDSGVIYVLVSGVLALLLWTAELELQKTLFHTAFLIGLSIYGLNRSRRTPKLVLDRNQLKSSAGTLLLGDIRDIHVSGKQITAKTRHNKFQLVIEPRDPEIAAFIGSDLERRILDSTTAPTTPTTPQEAGEEPPKTTTTPKGFAVEPPS